MNRTILRVFLFLIFILVFIPVSDSKSFPVPGQGEFSYQLYYYYDLRDRESFIQVTNNDNTSIDVHVQIFQSNFSCNENDFFDVYTQDDTHIYNMSDIQSNDGNPTGVVLPGNSYGFVVVTVYDRTTNLSENNPVLSGNFRIVDDSGYEYRSVAASYPVIDTTTMTNKFSFNFSPVGTTTSADVIGIAVQNAGAGLPNVSFSTDTTFSLITFDQNEFAESCPDETFSCASNIGLNNSITNSKGAIETLCQSTPYTEGLMRMSLTGTTTADFFVGFIGLNNGTNRGGMELFTSIPDTTIVASEP